MGPVVEKWLKAAVTAVYSTLGDALSEAREAAYRATGVIPYLNSQERAYLAEATMNMARQARATKRLRPQADMAAEMTRPYMMKPMEHAANQMDKRLQTKAKVTVLSDELARNRKGAEIFYLCSWHQTPAKGHRELQGKVYVDRYWRAVLKASGLSFWIPMVEDTIRRRGMMTVQEVTQAPYWLMFRPYCRHYFVPVPVLEVVGENTDRQILMNHPEARMKNHRSMTDDVRREKYVKRRSEIRRKLQKKKA